jgi:methanogenic corrinoid protein MtbC1/DNA-binding transcriptional MerR regulator
MNQAEIEQATGLSREVLRKWELRYQFPLPERGTRGQRLYRASDLPKLHLVKQLIGQGMRPAQLIPLSMQKLRKLLASNTEAAGLSDLDATVQKLLNCLAPGAPPDAVREYIAGLIQTQGLAEFVERQLAVFNQAVGDAWAAGRIGVHAEHHYTDAVMTGVQNGLLGCQTNRVQQRVLLTTPPGELHGLGLLSVQAALTLQGATCYNLGTQTPVADVVQAVKDWGITLLAISASILLRPEQARAYAQALRRALPKGCKIWVGGEGFASLNGAPVAGVTVFQSTAAAVQAWQKMTKVAVEHARAK